ncbi:hypothetical protein CHS0354_038572 [Potamilus streckersoni]|uniref:Enoyl reductase (ER) domain-containing protein n=1 Tax=Potamilus streckersoni TaxID=2493646 RepID=A0AAE0VI47_9BIVA|nr:hypothetical protein CHS0354_038572 [Potamilus streckersoni]
MKIATRKFIMRAVRVSLFGGPEVLKVEENVPIPTPKEDQVLIKVIAAGVNPVDAYIRSGTYGVRPNLPYTPGMDSAGVVEEVGPKVTKFKKGSRVFTYRSYTGTYAEYTLASEDHVADLHSSLTFEQGAAIGIPYYTAYRALMFKSGAKAGSTVLIHGASGAVGLACIQIGVAHGMTMLGTAGSPEGMELIKKNGASAVFNHRQNGYVQQITEAINGEGPDSIIEMLANVNLRNDINIIKRNGSIVIVGNRGESEINPRGIMTKECVITGVTLMQTSPEEVTKMTKGVQDGMAAGWLRPHISHRYSLADAHMAHKDLIESIGAKGKLIIKL